MTSLTTSSAQIQYIPLVVEALRAMNGSGKAAAVKEWVAGRLTESGQTIPDVVLTSGASKFTNDIQWARMYLVQADLLETTEKSGRGVWKLTPKGWSSSLDEAAARAIYSASSQLGKLSPSEDDGAAIETNSQGELDGTENWVSQLAKILKTMPDKGFERLCALIMTKTGMEARVTGKSNDGGVDGEGLLPIDELGLIKMAVAWQCKRFGNNNVGSPDIRDFRGAIAGRAQYGIFFATSGFTLNAIAEATRAGATPIETVDLERLVSIMGKHNIGVAAGEGDPSVRVLEHGFFDEYLHPVTSSNLIQGQIAQI